MTALPCRGNVPRVTLPADDTTGLRTCIHASWSHRFPCNVHLSRSRIAPVYGYVLESDTPENRRALIARSWLSCGCAKSHHSSFREAIALTWQHLLSIPPRAAPKRS